MGAPSEAKSIDEQECHGAVCHHGYIQPFFDLFPDAHPCRLRNERYGTNRQASALRASTRRGVTSSLRSELEKRGMDRETIDRLLLGLPTLIAEMVPPRSTVRDESCSIDDRSALLTGELITFLSHLDHRWSDVGLPSNLADEYVLGLALERATPLDARDAEFVAARAVGHEASRPDDTTDLKSVVSAFLLHRGARMATHHRAPSIEASRVETTEYPEPVSSPSTVSWLTPEPTPDRGLKSFLTRGRWLGRTAMVAAMSIALLLLVGAFYQDAESGLRSVHRYLWAFALSTLVLIIAGVSVGNRVALFLAMFLGIPLAFPFAPLGNEERALARRARWLSRFMGERPRGYNTPGAHVAYGVIAAKKTIKRFCVRRESRDAKLLSQKAARARLVEVVRDLSLRIARALPENAAEARRLSRREHVLKGRLLKVENRLFARRLTIQGEVVESFQRHWSAEYAGSHVSREGYQLALSQFEQPEGELPALLPNGLVRGPIAFLFEYGMFFGRVSLAVLFLATLHIPFLWLAFLLLILDFYVIEPVVLKFQISSMNLLLDIPGHKMVDLKAYVDALPADAVFRVPITVPKFSSNPAWTNLNALIRSACDRARVVTTSITPFVIYEGRRDTTIELTRAPLATLPARTDALAAALVTELRNHRSTFPLETSVQSEDGRVIVTLTDEVERIREFVGEDASQAFVYLRRNLDGLKDTLAHVGHKFVPVFIFASNSTDTDVVRYEIDNIAELQRLSNEEYGGQVGFLYLLRGGVWFNFNSKLKAFDSKDKDFAKALPNFVRALRGAHSPAREHLLSKITLPLDGQRLAEAFNEILGERDFHRRFDGFAFDALPPHLHPTTETLTLLRWHREGRPLATQELRDLNRDLLLTAFPMRVPGNFFKKVGNDIPVQELLVTGKTRPTMYIDRRRAEHVQDPSLPSFLQAWGDFARYTGLGGSNEQIHDAILRGRDIPVESVPEVGAVIDDKNHFAPGEVEKGLATMLHAENRHLVLGVPRINITFPRYKQQTMISKYIVSQMNAREIHNTADGQSRARIFDFSSAAYGKWWKRPRPYLAHYAQEVLNSAHALSHDFQQSYFVAGAAGRLGGFSEALYGTNHFRVRAMSQKPEHAPGHRRYAVLIGALVMALSALTTVTLR
jgi:hypothetical protein